MEETNPYEAPTAPVEESPAPEENPYGGGRLASPGTRLLAKLITGAAILVPALVPGLLDPIVDPTVLTMFMGAVGFVVMGVLALNIYWLYDNGQTIGKRAMGIKIVRSDRASRASLPRLLFLRHLSESIASGCCSLLWIADVLFIFTEERQCLHDLVADTAVVVEGTVPSDEGGPVADETPGARRERGADEADAFDDAVHEW